MSDNKINTGAIFKNKNKTAPNHPDYRGVVNVDGKEKELALWLKESKSGIKYFSVSVSEPYVNPAATAASDEPLIAQDDDLPF